MACCGAIGGGVPDSGAQSGGKTTTNDAVILVIVGKNPHPFVLFFVQTALDGAGTPFCVMEPGVIMRSCRRPLQGLSMAGFGVSEKLFNPPNPNIEVVGKPRHTEADELLVVQKPRA